MTVLVKGVLYIFRGPPLRAVAGHQEEGMLQPLAQVPDVRGIGGPGDRPGNRIAVFSHSVLGNALVQVAHGLIDLTVPGNQVLQFPGAGIGGLDQHKDALVLGLCGLQERVDGVGPHVAVERHAVRVKGRENLPLDLRSGEPALRVGGGGGADVPALDVGDHK